VGKKTRALQAQIAALQSQIGQLTSVPDTSAEDTAKLIETLTTAANEQIATLNTNMGAQLDELRNQNTSLTGYIAEQGESFAKSQAELLTQITDQSTKASKQMMEAIANLQGASGQAAKKPNYARALQRNKDLNSTGLSSTMLTGAAGVPATSLTLGKAALLGA
jgi:hypothetical protein